MRNNILIIIPFLLSVLLSASAFADNSVNESNDWVLGDWIHAYDPDGDSQDVLTFEEEGGFMTTEVSTGREFYGRYFMMKDGVIKINLYHQGKIHVMIELKHDEKKDKLYYTSKNTGNTSYYTKIKQKNAPKKALIFTD